MKKNHQDLIKNIDQLFSCLTNNRELKLLKDQREKLTFLTRFINEEEVTEIELDTIKPFWHKPIKDPLNVSYYIDEIAFLLRDNYTDIKLSNAEKVKPKNLIQLINDRVMTDEEEQIILYELNEKALVEAKRRIEKYEASPEYIAKERDKIDKELTQLNIELAEINKRIAALKSKQQIKS